MPYEAPSGDKPAGGERDMQKVARAVAVEIAIREADAQTPGAVCKPAQIRDLCDPRPFAACGTPENFRKAVQRVLEDRVKAPDSAIEAASGGWQLRRAAAS